MLCSSRWLRRGLLVFTISLPIGLVATAGSPDPASREALVEEYDWTAHFLRAGEARDGLRLALSAPQERYRFGDSGRLYLGLKNLRSVQRTLDGLPAHGRLGRSPALVFRIAADDGEELLVPNVIVERGGLHEHRPLVVESNGTVVDLISLDEMVATYSRLFDLVEGAERLTITAEVPAYELRSRTIVLLCGAEQ